MSGSVAEEYRCGPLGVRITGFDCAEFRRVRRTLDIYSARWSVCSKGYKVDLLLGAPHPGMLAGDWLKTARTHVDSVPQGLRATCLSGLHGCYDHSDSRWTITIPPGPADIWHLTDVDDLVSLVLTTGWRELGWVPVHAGAVVRNGSCVLLCAPSGGGKTTLATALLLRGWDSLGDDKLLLRCVPGASPEARALVHSLNLFPHSVRWFPELEGIKGLPMSGVWTDKRRVPMAMIRAGSTVQVASPTHIVRVVRRTGTRGVRVISLTSQETLDLFIRQTVIPGDHELAGVILGTIAGTAAASRGLCVEVGDDAYDVASHLDVFEQAICA